MFETRCCAMCGEEFRVNASGFTRHTKYCTKHTILIERTKLYPRLWAVVMQHYPEVAQDVLRIEKADRCSTV